MVSHAQCRWNLMANKCLNSVGLYKNLIFVCKFRQELGAFVKVQCPTTILSQFKVYTINSLSNIDKIAR